MLHIECKTCGAALTIDDHHRSSICPYCASPNVVERPPQADAHPPAFAIGFAVPRERAVEHVRAWSRQGLFRHGGLDDAAISELRGVYVPAWLYAATARAAYAANIGEEYTVTKTRTVMQDGKMVTETYTETETEWHALDGTYLGYVSDVLVTASQGVGNAELEALEPFDLRALARYSPAMVSGWTAEAVSLAAADSIALAQQEALAVVSERVRKFMPGDSCRDLRVSTELTARVADVLLLPIWIVALRHAESAPPVRVLVNGQTGKIVGERPISWVKVAAAIVVLVLLGLAVLVPVLLGTHR